MIDLYEYYMNNLVLMVVEQINCGEWVYDIFLRFLKEYIIFVVGLIEDGMVSLVIV